MKVLAKIFCFSTLLFNNINYTQASSPDHVANKAATHQEILRGSITPERAWWDLTHYHLAVNVDPSNKSISGSNTMKYKVLSKPERLQIELQAPLILEKVTQNGKTLVVEKDGYSYFITTVDEQKLGQDYQLTMYYSGVP